MPNLTPEDHLIKAICFQHPEESIACDYYEQADEHREKGGILNRIAALICVKLGDRHYRTFEAWRSSTRDLTLDEMAECFPELDKRPPGRFGR